MKLTDEQERILAGAKGPFLAKCIRWLVEWGEAMGARRLGYAATTQRAGGYVFCDSCPTNSMRVKAKRIVTAGFKQAHYARGMIAAEVIVDHQEGCLHAALTGKWSP